MIIAIDGYEANTTNRVGVGRYAYEILLHIHKILAADKAKRSQIKIRVYVPEKPLPDMPPASSWWQYRLSGPKRMWTFIGLPWALLMDNPKPDVVFSPTHYMPRFISYPRVISIMDLSYSEYPELFRKKDLHQLVHWTNYSVLHASCIFTISEFSRNAIIKKYPVSEKSVVVTYPGFTMNKDERSNTDEVLMRNLPKEYVLSVGTIQPRKNYSRLIEAFAAVANSLKSQIPELMLLIVGKKGWLYEDIIDTPKRLGIQDKVKFLDFVPDQDLPDLYRKALCFALPSLYEGFGLPVLEAMTYSCPVVISNVSSLPEIAGKSGIYVNPEDTDSIAQGIIKAITERNSNQGKLRIKEGLLQAKKFTWEQAAQKTLDVLTEVGKEK